MEKIGSDYLQERISVLPGKAGGGYCLPVNHGLVEAPMTKPTILALAALSLAGCQTTSQTPHASMPTREQAISWLTANKERIFIDPDSVRGFAIGPIGRDLFGNIVVCNEANSRNRFGGFTGLKLGVTVFTPSGRFLDGRDPNWADGCGQGPYTPVPAMNGRAA